MSLFQRTEFFTSAAKLENLPDNSRGEIAFAGRSNAGKSSALNTLVRRKRLAFVSKTPGRTQLLNFFSLGEDRYLVDLPGYGYAKVPGKVRAPWEKLIGDYLRGREPLLGLVVVMDARHPLTPLDLYLIEWFSPTLRPIHVLLTKSDKLTSSEARRTLKEVSTELARLSPLFSAQLFSSLKKQGIEEAEAVLSGWFNPGAKPAAEVGK